MARTRKPLKPRTEWRYGALHDEPLFIWDEVSPGKVSEVFVEFVKEISHQKVTVRIRDEYHYFFFHNFSARKRTMGEERWMSRLTYRSLEVMADHIMRAHFCSFGTYNKPSQKPLYVEGERVTLLSLSKTDLVFSWQKESYRLKLSGSEMLFEEGARPLPPHVRRFFERFAIEVMPKLPVYRTDEEREAAPVERRLAKTEPSTLFSEKDVVSVKVKKVPTYKPKPQGAFQPRLI